jgi:AraC-like DNA-binding protein
MNRTDAAAEPAHAPIELLFQGRDDWQEGLRRHVLPFHCSVPDPLAFRCKAIVGRLGGSAVAELRVDAARLVRRPLDADADSVVKVMWQLAGHTRVQQGPSEALLEAGTWMICDPAREYILDFEQGSQVLLILVPRSQCSGWAAALNELAAQALPARGAANIALAVLAAMLRNAAHLGGESESSLLDSVVSLIDRALNEELGARDLPGQHERSTRLSRVQAYIHEHLSDHSLSVDRIAAAFGMSRRSLYNVFASAETSPRAYIQKTRMDRACELLRQAIWRSAPVARVAVECGFSDPAHFSRAFHARFGAAPTAWREERA